MYLDQSFITKDCDTLNVLGLNNKLQIFLGVVKILVITCFRQN